MKGGVWSVEFLSRTLTEIDLRLMVDQSVTSLLLVRMSPNTVCVRACALVLAVVTCPFVFTAYSREHE